MRWTCTFRVFLLAWLLTGCGGSSSRLATDQQLDTEVDVWEGDDTSQEHLDEDFSEGEDFHQSEDRQGARLMQPSYNVRSRGITYFYMFPLTHTE